MARFKYPVHSLQQSISKIYQFLRSHGCYFPSGSRNHPQISRHIIGRPGKLAKAFSPGHVVKRGSHQRSNNFALLHLCEPLTSPSDRNQLILLVSQTMRFQNSLQHKGKARIRSIHGYFTVAKIAHGTHFWKGPQA